MEKKPLFITLEGIDGCGKSTQLKNISIFLDKNGIDHITTREPGGCRFGKLIRKILLEPEYDALELDIRTETVLFYLDRLEHNYKVIQPALALNKWVICDRYIHSTHAYQHAGKGLRYNDLLEIYDTFHKLGVLYPNKTIIFDTNPEIVQKRIKDRDPGDNNKFDNYDIDFMKRTCDFYKSLISKDVSDIIPINGNRELRDVTTSIKQIMGELINDYKPS